VKRFVVLITALAAAGGLAAWALASTVFFSPPATIVQYGHIRSIRAAGGAYELRLDPAYWLGGLTAQMAAAQAGQEVDNDYFILDPEHRQLAYKLPANASATVLTNSNSGIKSTHVPISELAQIVKGKNPVHRPLLENGSLRTLGYWVKTNVDTVKSIDQQYQP
jgi:hypothetical protein